MGVWYYQRIEMDGWNQSKLNGKTNYEDIHA
jgi:hypothetical protein